MPEAKPERTREDGAMNVALTCLREMIVCGVLLPGEQIRQQEVAEQCGVSRVPLREALNVLARQGLLMHRPNAGYFVAKRQPIELAQIRRMLHLLENELMRSLALPDDRTLAELEMLNEEMRTHALKEDWTPLLALNHRFHFKIFELSPYRLILDQVERLWAIADPYIAGKLALQESRVRTTEDHAKLLDALRRKDRQACVTLLDDHRSGHSGGLPFDLPEAASAGVAVARQKEEGISSA